jgi:hypothetical protein
VGAKVGVGTASGVEALWELQELIIILIKHVEISKNCFRSIFSSASQKV